MSKTKIWLEAFRLRTLPLAFSCIIVGNALAFVEGEFSYLVFALTLLTALFLQVLSNLANDYGDSQKGTDNLNRVGPERTVQKGDISPKAMKIAIIIFVLLSLASGISLILIGLSNISLNIKLIFLIVGIAAIAAAIKYTVGKKAFGYHGFGDLFVFIFFGLVGVIGSYYLHTHRFDFLILLPAASIGFLSTGVLNLNNIRDIENDKISGKNTIPVKIGLKAAKFYHASLLTLAIACSIIYVILKFESYNQYAFVVVLPTIIGNIISVFKIKECKDYDKLLKPLAITTFIFAVVFSAGLIISYFA
ncbi:MAG: 1,4-dihydroxy-2-naphthoate polyprenyltransferase [Saprospiraceae bacterium]|nr:1,4-dihydroxy-2-naphthoate polyprenyltransferase [Saprospiraceae bacterium]